MLKSKVDWDVHYTENAFLYFEPWKHGMASPWTSPYLQTGLSPQLTSCVPEVTIRYLNRHAGDASETEVVRATLAFARVEREVLNRFASLVISVVGANGGVYART